jgi:fatty acid desaturase
MPFHSEHHLYPNVPFYHLEKIHKHVANRVIVEPEGYVAGQRKIIQWLRNRPKVNYSGSPQTPIL